VVSSGYSKAPGDNPADKCIMNRKYIITQITSFFLPVLVLIVVPLWIEKSIKVFSIASLIAGLLIICAGLCTVIITVSTFIRTGKGSLAPWSPPRNLVISGIYRHVRNPMILGVLVTLIGESVVILSLKILVWALAFFIINNIWFLIYEEPHLERKFGDEYRDYKKNVHRWIPKLKPFMAETEKQKKSDNA
jgi:protein-S-isoprenylcysteine O-methyltransferase Ste14